jgi:hypothetical protein
MKRMIIEMKIYFCAPAIGMRTASFSRTAESKGERAGLQVIEAGEQQRGTRWMRFNEHADTFFSIDSNGSHNATKFYVKLHRITFSIMNGFQ